MLPVSQLGAGGRVLSVHRRSTGTACTLATPSGMDTLTVSVLVIPGINLGNVGFDDATQKLTGLSTDQITFTP